MLASYAASDQTSRGRLYDEAPPAYRSAYQRDRDRIIHSSAFRRLVYKTQVFVNHEGDLYRTRLTHSLEVAQIARTAARALGLNEDLVEAICLAHDLGHTPFGHAGQDALNYCMRDYGGFEHNFQSLRVVDELEEKYADFPGLNLTFETREGILKHCSINNAQALGELGARFVDRTRPGLEAQLANLADEIAYNNHDVDDGLRAGLLKVDELAEVPIFRDQFEKVERLYPEIADRRSIYETVRRMIDHVVTDLVETSQENIQRYAPTAIDDVRNAPEDLIAISDSVREQHIALKRFLGSKLYKHHKVLRMTTKAKKILSELFEVFFSDTRLMPMSTAQTAEDLERQEGEQGRARAVADYIAGMTDRFAIREHSRVFDPHEPT